ncbi:MAG: hypothetical protein KW788_04685 [Candidatus Doudnabacteria bacterium]|nr:hypothetical protein [Candidatus Doudnabacteria bacterium]
MRNTVFVYLNFHSSCTDGGHLFSPEARQFCSFFHYRVSNPDWERLGVRDTLTHAWWSPEYGTVLNLGLYLPGASRNPEAVTEALRVLHAAFPKAFEIRTFEPKYGVPEQAVIKHQGLSAKILEFRPADAA